MHEPQKKAVSSIPWALARASQQDTQKTHEKPTYVSKTTNNFNGRSSWLCPRNTPYSFLALTEHTGEFFFLTWQPSNDFSFDVDAGSTPHTRLTDSEFYPISPWNGNITLHLQQSCNS
jgi:hypothetical protein